MMHHVLVVSGLSHYVLWGTCQGYPGYSLWHVELFQCNKFTSKGKACPIYLESTHARALRAVPLEALMMHAVGDEA